MINILLQYLRQYKWYAISSIIMMNIVTQLLKLVIYRNLTEYITTITSVFGSNNIIISFFSYLFIIHLIQNLIKYLLEKIVLLGIRDLFGRIVNCVMFNKMDFYKKDIHNKINQIWLYLNNIEVMISKLIIDLPRILTFIMFYIYMIYSVYSEVLLFLIPAILFTVLTLHQFSKKQYRLQKERMYLDMDVKNKLLEATTNIEFVKLNTRENHECKRINNAFIKYTNNKIKEKWVEFAIDFLSHIYNDFLLLIIYSIGIFYIVNDSLKPIDLLYLGVNTGNFYYQTMQMKDIYNYYMRINPKLEIIYHILGAGEEKVEDKLVSSDIFKCNTDNENIVFKNITFSYDGKINVINNLNFEFIGKKINLLLGQNGSGKSTLIKLLLRLYELNNDNNDANKIYFNGTNIKELTLKELRKRIVFVSQEPHIFNESILYNIKYGNEKVYESKIIELCDIIYSRDWLIQNKDKQTGFRGRNLSGGEKKKIQLINAICRDAEVIIFDEPTNTLDSNALIWFINFIKLLRDKYNKTIIIITHDLRLKDVSDNVIDLNK
jgi:ABC-type multidrug transport system fused ATPase/permease subunit